MMNQLSNGGIKTASAMRLSEWLKQWYTLYLPNIEHLTRESYIERIEHRIIPVLGAAQLKSLSAAMIQRWVNEMKEELSPKSVKNVFIILKAALNKAVELKMIETNPCTGVVLPKMQKYQGDAYSQEEIQQTLNLAKGTDMYLILLLAFSLGLRRGELLAITWDDVDFENAEITINKSTFNDKGERIVKTPKTVSGIRTIPLGKNLLNELKVAHRKYLENKLLMGSNFDNSNLIICQENGSPYHTDSFSNKWKRFVKKHNIRYIRFHDIRHSNATALIAAGVDIKTVQKRLGHSDISTTMNIYAHVTAKMDENAANTIDNIVTA